MNAFVTMNRQGRITLPTAARKLLGIEGETQFELVVDEHEAILRPAVVIPREDAWAYTPENLAAIRRAQENAKAGHVHTGLTENDLKRMAGNI